MRFRRSGVECDAAAVAKASAEGPSTAEVDAAIASYARCRERGGFIEAFYERLWQRDHAIKQRFAGTDMERQHQVMREAINTLMMFAGGSSIARMALERLSRSHSPAGYDVSPEQYQLFAEALIETARSFDPRWQPQLETAWREALTPGLDYLAG